MLSVPREATHYKFKLHDILRVTWFASAALIWLHIYRFRNINAYGWDRIKSSLFGRDRFPMVAKHQIVRIRLIRMQNKITRRSAYPLFMISQPREVSRALCESAPIFCREQLVRPLSRVWAERKFLCALAVRAPAKLWSHALKQRLQK